MRISDWSSDVCSSDLDSQTADSSHLRVAALRDAAAADIAVVFLGLPPSWESEGWDRDHIDLPAHQLDLLSAVVEVQPRTVRSEERRVGKAGVRTCRSRWSPYQ